MGPFNHKIKDIQVRCPLDRGLEVRKRASERVVQVLTQHTAMVLMFLLHHKQFYFAMEKILSDKVGFGCD